MALPSRAEVEAMMHSGVCHVTMTTLDEME